MEKWLNLLSIIPEPFRFIVLAMIAICISYFFFAKVLAAVIIGVFKIKLPSDDNNDVGFGLRMIRRVFWTTWTVGAFLILYFYYHK
jgi:hypothetical protein